LGTSQLITIVVEIIIIIIIIINPSKVKKSSPIIIFLKLEFNLKKYIYELNYIKRIVKF
jgi:hypothetical protein